MDENIVTPLESSETEYFKRQKYIHSKGFNMVDNDNYNLDTELMTNYNKIKVGPKALEDAVLTLGDLNSKPRGIHKGVVLKALAEKDLGALRTISEYFYNTSGIYARLCNYVAQLYRYDWYIIPEVLEDGIKEDKIVKEEIKLLHYLDNSYIKKTCGDIALKVIKYGSYYGYLVPDEHKVVIQELPPAYCRTRYSVNGMPAIEFNMAYFDQKFPSLEYRLKVLKLFPPEFAKGYSLYKQGKLIQDELYEDRNRDWKYGGPVNTMQVVPKSGWYLLEPGCAFKFNLNNSDIPFFANVIPSILDLDAAQDLDRRKQMQQLLKIIVQKLPLDKNGDLIFDIDEARDIHNNAVDMLQRAVGVDVLTTFADIQAINTQDKNTTATQDDLEKMERQVYNASGVSKNLFNTDGNLSLSTSILEDESTLRNLLLQFEIFYDRIVESKNTNKKKFSFSLYFLETTQYNYKEIAKMYKEQVQLGYSKMLPQIALGHPQSTIINTVYFENEILHLPEIMIPPLMSSTLNGQDVLGNKNQSNNSNSQNKAENKTSSTSQKTTVKVDSGKSGRPEKPDSQKSEKTIQNKESMS